MSPGSNRKRCGAGDERGVAIVWSLALITMIGLAAFLAAAVGGLVATRQEVSTIADLAAVAGAQSLGDPCGSAAAVVRSNGAQLVGCQVVGADVVADVALPAPTVVVRLLAVLGAGPPAMVRVSARAGLPVG